MHETTEMKSCKSFFILISLVVSNTFIFFLHLLHGKTGREKAYMMNFPCFFSMVLFLLCTHFESFSARPLVLEPSSRESGEYPTQTLLGESVP